MAPSRETVNEMLDRAFFEGEAQILLGSLEEADAFSTALLKRAESLTREASPVCIWGLDELPARYCLRVAWLTSHARRATE